MRISKILHNTTTAATLFSIAFIQVPRKVLRSKSNVFRMLRCISSNSVRSTPILRKGMEKWRYELPKNPGGFKSAIKPLSGRLGAILTRQRCSLGSYPATEPGENFSPVDFWRALTTTMDPTRDPCNVT